MEQSKTLQFGRWHFPPFSASTLSTLYAADVYQTLGLGTLSEQEAESIGKGVLHTAMNACLKHSKGGQTND